MSLGLVVAAPPGPPRRGERWPEVGAPAAGLPPPACTSCSSAPSAPTPCSRPSTRRYSKLANPCVMRTTSKCQNGHTLCSTCKARVHNRCPTCRQELGDIRCLALEKVAESLELPCKYCSLGCPEIFPYYSKIKHEAQCSFRPYNCPYAGSECAVAGDIPFLVAHLRDDHKVDMHSGCTFNHRYVKSNPREVENATWMLTVFHCFGQYFCLHFEAFQLGMAPVYMAFLRFMGDENEARNYTYSLEVGGNGRKMVWEGTPRSIRDSHRKVRDSHDGLIIQRNMALFFSGGDRKELKLRVTGRIWKEQTNPDGACIPNLCS
nr:E3 ubiquitin-protein ligase SINAT5 isoform X2 [Oryza sativa Japonica Group]